MNPVNSRKHGFEALKRPTIQGESCKKTKEVKSRKAEQVENEATGNLGTSQAPNFKPIN
jgi:hypothetical protein